MDISIRTLSATDYPHLARIYFIAVYEGTRELYSFQQRFAWAGETIDLAAWQQRCEMLQGFVAVKEDEPVGFLAMDEKGYIDLLFVLPSFARQGVGAQLLDRAQQLAQQTGVEKLTAFASLVSQPFFSRQGWEILSKEVVVRKGVSLDRYAMQKDLSH
ncbi:GNAT family N-acetyltransferase [Candidatus Pantoea multigeneris]|nr:GNAT family N-acetyltransferase [Pantoea multigeneris]